MLEQDITSLFQYSMAETEENNHVITMRNHGGQRKDNTATMSTSYLEALHGLVLRNAAGAVGAADDGSVSTSVLISTTIPPFLGHGLSPAVRTLPSIVTNLLKDSVKLT